MTNSIKRISLPPLAGLMEDPGIGVTDDARMIAAYLQRDNPLPPLPLAIGDPYLLGGTLPAGLAAYERKAPRHLGGYSRTPAGVPEARHLAAAWIIRKQGLEGLAALGTDFDVHLTSATGTRGIMGDFGRYLLDRQSPEDARTPVVLCAAPSWDYAGVFEPIGYRMAFWPLRPERGWMPDTTDIEQALAAIDAGPGVRLGVVAINTQHNPTGCSWDAATVDKLLEAATARGAGILLDDPYNTVVTDRATPVSAPARLFEHLGVPGIPADAQRLWCRVESFGKTFSCNDWGIGTIMAHPDTLSALSEYTFRWAFPRAGNRQWAMAKWISDPASDRYLARQRTALGRKRKVWAETLRHLGWPEALTTVGEATPYYLIALPPRYASLSDGAHVWRQELMDTTGVLLSFASIEQEDTAADVAFLRIYLGGSEAVVAECARRFQAADIRYDQPMLPNKEASKQQ
jgi:N-succinyldiaminopimelate aminotransferase